MDLINYQFSSSLLKFKKLQTRFRKRFADGTWNHLPVSKRNQILHKLDKLRDRISFLSALLKKSCIASVLAVGLQEASAQTKAGSEMLVNTFTVSRQANPAIAHDHGGDYIIVWQSYDQDGSYYGIYGQRYDVSGTPKGSEFKINETNTNTQKNPSVAMDDDGNFVVAWEQDNGYPDYSEIYARRYSASGSPVSSEFHVNTTNFVARQNSPVVAMDDDGDFVIAWQSRYTDGSYYGVYAQRYDASGTKQGGEFLVNTITSNNQHNPSIAMDSDGDFILVWQSYIETKSFEIKAQRYTSSGALNGSEFTVNTYTTGIQNNPAVGMDSDGNFVVAWESDQGDTSEVFAQRFDHTGTALGSEFKANTTTTDVQGAPYIVMDEEGDFVITWESKEDGVQTEIYGRAYNASGTALGAEFMVNTWTTDSQKCTSVASDNNGDFIVVWQSYTDSDVCSISMQRFTNSITSALDPSLQQNSMLYPNPSSDKVYVSGPVVFSSVEILDLSGVVVKSKTLDEYASLDVSDLPSGFYILNFRNKEGRIYGAKLEKR